MDIKINNLLKADVFSSLFQHIKLFTEHINITFSDEKMYLQTMDGSRVSIVEMNLPNSWFDEYTINNSAITMGVQANVLFKVLNCRDKDQIIHLEYEADSDKLCIHFTSENKQSFDKHFEINLIDLDVELLEIPSFDSNTDISVPSSYFAGIITQLQIFGDTIEFECSEEKVQLISHSVDSGKMKVDIDVDELTGYSITEGEVMKISFSLSRIHNICNYHKLSKEMDIILTHDYPMKIIYKLDEEDASMVFYLAPKIGDD
jgi:proliferating cell nuclear antigen